MEALAYVFILFLTVGLLFFAIFFRDAPKLPTGKSGEGK